jgi:hypothetical protein
MAQSTEATLDKEFADKLPLAMVTAATAALPLRN